MLKKILYIFIMMLFLSCASTHKIHYETVTVKGPDNYFINNWKKNGVRIIDIDTIKNIKGEIEGYKVKLR